MSLLTLSVYAQYLRFFFFLTTIYIVIFSWAMDILSPSLLGRLVAVIMHANGWRLHGHGMMKSGLSNHVFAIGCLMV